MKNHSDKVFIVKALLPYFDDEWRVLDDSPYRTFAVPANSNIYNLAEKIVESFELYFYPEFAFYDNFRDISQSERIIENRFKQIRVENMFTPGNKKWLLLFNFEEEWNFWLSLTEIVDNDEELATITLVESEGEAPKGEDDDLDDIEDYDLAGDDSDDEGDDDEEFDEDDENSVFDGIMDTISTPEFVNNFLNVMTDKVLKDLKKGILSYGFQEKKSLAEIFNNIISFPLAGKYKINEQERIVEVNFIYQENQIVKNEMCADCTYNGEIIRVPLHRIEIIDNNEVNELLNNYKKWFFLNS